MKTLLVGKYHQKWPIVHVIWCFQCDVMGAMADACSLTTDACSLTEQNKYESQRIPIENAVANWRKGVANWRKGVEQIRNVNHGEIHLKMQCKWKWQIGGREWQTGGREWQTGGRDKSSSTAAPSALLRVLSLKKFDFTC